MENEGKECEKGLTAQALETKPKYRLDAIRWSRKDGRYQKIMGLKYSDDVDELVDFCRHPKKNGGFDRAVIYLVGEDGGEKIVETVHSVMGRLYCHGGVESIDPISEGPKAKKKRKSGRAVRLSGN